MKEVVQLIHEMQAAGVIHDYAFFGAIAQMRYTEPVITLDVDVLVDIPSPDRIDSLAGVYEFCARKGYRPEGEAVRVGSWPVQFLPAFNALTREAMVQAETCEFDGIPSRVVRAEYLATIALSTGRSKDHERILALLESGKTSRENIETLARRHGLGEAWQRFARRFLDE
ncbi:MAG TPA: hypothetical protein VJX29_07380 [Candidatus Acidoferrales bacterium]|nr:hypothetical protein [Candidatus Acidoferrales bacterium]